MHIIVTGDPIDGFQFYGPFDTEDEATETAERDFPRPASWWIAPLRLHTGKNAV